MTTTEAPVVMEEPIETAVGHATEALTERDRLIAEDSGSGMVTGTTVAGGTILVTVGAVVKGHRIPLPAAATAHALGRPRRMVSRAKIARSRNQLSLHRPKRRPRQIRRLSGSASSKP